jgi:tetratricopeptide (TPR) repeat protein
VLALGVLSFVQTANWANSSFFWDRCLAVNRASSACLGNKAIDLTEHGHYLAATELFQKALRANPNFHATNIDNLGKCYLAAGDYEKASQCFTFLIHSAPNNLKNRYNEARTLLMMNRYSDAIPQIRAAIALSPNMPELLELLGNAYDGSGDYRDAYIAYSSAYSAKPAMLQYLREKSDAAMKLHLYHDAKIGYKSLLRQRPQSAELKSLLAKAQAGRQ